MDKDNRLLQRAAKHDAEAAARLARRADVTTMPQMVLGRHIKLLSGTFFIPRHPCEGDWDPGPCVRVKYFGHMFGGHEAFLTKAFQSVHDWEDLLPYCED